MQTPSLDPKRDLVLDRTVDVPASRIWAAWTTPALILQWFTPAPWKTVACDIDVRPGGRFHTIMQSPEGEQFPNTGCILEAIENQRLTFTSVLGENFRPLPKPENGAHDLPFTATIQLAPAKGGGTHYVAIARHADEAGARQHADMGFTTGWGAALDQLVALMKKG